MANGTINRAVNITGDTMHGELLTSFRNAVAMGSRRANATTIPNLVEELRFSSGCMGSANIGTAFTHGQITIGTGWYNYLYIPHGSGGANGAANADNADYTNYGTLILFGMTFDSRPCLIRVSNGVIASVRVFTVATS